MLKRIFKNEFIKGSFFMTSAALVGGMINYFCNILNARYLGPAKYGEFAALISYFALAGIPLSVVMTFILQKISSGRDNLQRIRYAKTIEILVWEKIKKWWFIFPFSLVIIFFLPSLLNISFVSTLTLMIVFYLSIISSMYLTNNQGIRLFFMITIVSLTAVITRFLGPVLVMFGIDGYTTVLVFFVLSYIALSIGHYFLFRKNSENINIESTKINENRILDIMRNPYFIMVAFSTFATIFFSSFDIVFVKKYFSGVDTGIYSLWIVCARILYFLLGPIIGLGFIFFSNTTKKHEGKRVFIISLFLIIIGGVINYGVYRFAGAWFIQTFFGAKYIRVIPYLEKASLFAVFYSITMFFINYYLANKKKILYIMAFGVIIYGIALFLSGKTIENVMNINIWFSGIISGILFSYYLFEKRVEKR